MFTKSTTEYYLMIISNPLFKFGGNIGNFKKVINYLKTLTTENYLRWFPKLYESTFLLLFRHDGNNIRNVWSLMLFNFVSCLYLKTYWFECVLASTLPFVNFDSGSNAKVFFFNLKNVILMKVNSENVSNASNLYRVVFSFSKQLTLKCVIR